MIRLTLLLALVLAALATASCSDDSPTFPSDSPTRVTELFTGTLSPGGSTFYSFNVFDPSYVSAMLASVTATGPALSTPLGLALGVPQGEGCEASADATVAAPALVAQLTAYRSTGTYCVSVSDAGQLTTTVTFSVRLSHF